MLRLLDRFAPTLAKVRDLVIVGAAVNYLIGYIVVATYSIQNGFGFIRALDTQYVVAGLIPSLVILSLLLIWWMGTHLGRRSAKRAIARSDLRGLRNGRIAPRHRWIWFGLSWPDARERMAYSRSRAIVLWPTLAITAICGWFYFTNLDSPWILGITGTVLVFLLVHMFAFIFGWAAYAEAQPSFVATLPRKARISLRSRNPGAELSMGLVVLSFVCSPMLMLLFLTTYVNAVFPSIPLEVGGAKSRCAAVVIKDKALQDALPGSNGGAPVPLWWELAGDPYVFSLPAEPRKKGVPRSTWLIPQSAVLAIGPCDHDKAKAQ